MANSVTRVDFYLLAGEGLSSVRLFCCRLAEKAWKLGHQVWIRTENAEATRQLKKQGRLRYSHYDKSNYTLKHHTLN